MTEPTVFIDGIKQTNTHYILDVICNGHDRLDECHSYKECFACKQIFCLDLLIGFDKNKYLKNAICYCHDCSLEIDFPIQRKKLRGVQHIFNNKANKWVPAKK